jgi:Skp family chaperone for outer membrane proteins
MNWKTLFLGCLLSMSLYMVSFAQGGDKIGYANFELILSYMPEAETIGKNMQSFQQGKAKQLKIKEDYAKMKLQEYQQRAQGGASEADLKPLGEELQKLDQEIKKFAAQAEQQVYYKRQQELEPALNRLSDAIKKVAESGNYTFVLNSTDFQARSILVHGPDEHNLNLTILKELGVDVEDDDSNN